MLLRKKKFVHITSQAEFTQFIKQAQQSSILAIDTEFIREKTYYPQLCLIQCAYEFNDTISCVSIDPFALSDLSEFVSVLTDKHITKVFHACTQDIEIILDEVGVIPQPLFDTQIGNAFLGGALQVGYGALVEQYCKVVLDKSEALTDWSARPLDEAQLTYALNDVKYLPYIYKTMKAELIEQGRLSWVEDELSALNDPAHYRLQPADMYRKVKRISSLKRRQLGCAQLLASWRELSAQVRNIPRRRVLSDELVVEISKRMISNKRALAKVRGIDQLSSRDIEKILSLVQQAEKLTEDKLPPSLAKRPIPYEVESVADLMNALLKIVAEKAHIAAPLIAQRGDLTDFARGDKNTALHTGWRYELLGKLLEQLLAGELSLTVQSGRVEISSK